LPQKSINEILKKLSFLGGGEFAPQREYGCSAPKVDIPHPQVQETFPENFVKIG